MLINKLHHICIRQQLGGCIQDFSHNRFQSVVYGGESIYPCQGYVWRPTGINSLDPFYLHLKTMISNTVFLLVLQCMYADNTVISKIDAYALQSVLDNVISWSNSNGMSLNPSKCTLLPISRRRQHLFSHNYNIQGKPLFQKITNILE